MTTNQLLDLKTKAKQLRKRIIELSYEAVSAHISSCLSIADILTVLYWEVLKVNPQKPNDPNRDRFILSKGHAAQALYAVLNQRGFFKERLLKTYGKNGTLFGAHAEHRIAGIELSTGSLGHGLSVGAGLSLAAKLHNLQYKVYVLLSDGECDTGTVWEAALFAAHHKLSNLVVIVDYNKIQAFGKVKKVLNLEPFYKKWSSFNWAVKEIDGHNINKLLGTFKAKTTKDKPTVIIAHTIAGKGISFMENKIEWHYFNLNEKQYSKAIKEIDSS